VRQIERRDNEAQLSDSCEAEWKEKLLDKKEERLRDWMKEGHMYFCFYLENYRCIAEQIGKIRWETELIYTYSILNKTGVPNCETS
jgi:phage terminase large subunit-like protein